MKHNRIAVLSALVLIVLLLASCASSKAMDTVVRTIEVSGNGQVTVEPDIATFSIQVSEMGQTTSEAQNLANTKMKQLRDVMRGNGIEDKDIANTALNLRPSYQWIDGKQVLEGQAASQTLTVTVRNLNILGSLFDQLGEVSGISLNSVVMDKGDKNEALQEARRLALKQAMDKAELFATNAGMTVGKPITISENSVASNPYSPRLKMAMAVEAYDMPTEIPAGTLTITSTVSMVLEMH